MQPEPDPKQPLQVIHFSSDTWPPAAGRGRREPQHQLVFHPTQPDGRIRSRQRGDGFSDGAQESGFTDVKSSGPISMAEVTVWL